jgi:hypothetical protein
MRINYIIIPDPVLIDERLNIHAKILYGHVFRLTQSKGFCWATNAALAELMARDERSVQRWLKELLSCGYITQVLAGWQRKIFCSDIKDLGDPPFVERKHRRPERPKKDDTIDVDRDSRDDDSGDVGRLASAKNGDSLDVQNNIKKNTSTTTTTTGQISHPTTEMSHTGSLTLFSDSRATLATGSKIWQEAKQAFLTNRILIERMATSKRIAPAAVEALMAEFINDLELREEWGSFNRLQGHFLHWFNKGREKGFILPDGSLKNQPTTQPNEQVKRPREKTADDILKQFGNPGE